MGGATHRFGHRANVVPDCQAWQDNNANVTELVERTRAVAGGAEVLLVGRVVSATLQSSVLMHACTVGGDGDDNNDNDNNNMLQAELSRRTPATRTNVLLSGAVGWAYWRV